MDALTIEHFRGRQGQRFVLVTDSARLDLVLAEVSSRSRGRRPAGAREPFSLFFDGTRGQPCRQGTYRLFNDELGEIELFIVPVARNGDDTYRYQAVFA